VVLSCIDSRSAPEIVFDQGIGDVFSPRIAGKALRLQGMRGYPDFSPE
jgi:carbonic anhydrase